MVLSERRGACRQNVNPDEECRSLEIAIHGGAADSDFMGQGDLRLPGCYPLAEVETLGLGQRLGSSLVDALLLALAVPSADVLGSARSNSANTPMTDKSMVLIARRRRRRVYPQAG